MGGVQYPHLNEITRKIWQWCETRNIYLFASYVQSKDNFLADKESRRDQSNIEFELADNAFKEIASALGQPEIDLFASRSNTKCKKYVSWKRDPDAVSIDAFTIPWNGYFFYAFPPFSLLLKTIRKIENEKARGIIVAPYWPTQPWYPMFASLLESKPMFFSPHRSLLTSTSGQPHPLHLKLTLVAGILSGKH